MQLKKIAQTKLPTKWGEFDLIGFKAGTDDKEHLALVFGDVHHVDSVLVRIHSECLTGDALFSLRCDCGFQLESALKQISEVGCGILIYHRQEGRNIGLINKIKAYSLQDQGYDTVEANEALGFKADERDFKPCAEILKLLKINKIKLITNNPAKITALEKFDIVVTERISLKVGENENNKKYLKTKANKLGHLLD